jgi:hypothetical protein
LNASGLSIFLYSPTKARANASRRT